MAKKEIEVSVKRIKAKSKKQDNLDLSKVELIQTNTSYILQEVEKNRNIILRLKETGHTTPDSVTLRLNSNKWEIIQSFNSEIDVRKEIVDIFEIFNINYSNNNAVITYILENYYIFTYLFELLKKISFLMKKCTFTVKLSKDPEIGNEYLVLNFTYEKGSKGLNILDQIDNHFATIPNNVRDCIVLDPKSFVHELLEA